MSDPELHARASALFLELRLRPPAERTAALECAVAGDERLRREVLSLLQHDRAPHDGALHNTVPKARPPHALPPHAPPPPGLHPDRLGPYRVLRAIGRGGSGQVFLAEQEHPIQRLVAIKIVPEAASSPESAARFEVERRALERTHHPNIARILDAGRTAEGLPFLVMDYVDGVPITEYCARHALDLEARVRLLLPVADAVQHAHQRGVIHRDIKPANVLISEDDGRAAPHVLDFGIAKPIAGQFGQDSPPTSGLPVGTLAYMAPEQTTLGPVDTRADVYALGALAFELVAGRPPIEPGGDPLQWLERIRHEVPLAASRAAGARTTRRGRSRPGSLERDLDQVVAKALEKAPERRYATVAALREDLARCLAREPIEARAPSVRYRLARFAERRRALVIALTLAAAALLVGILGLALGLREARRQRLVALDQGAIQAEINRFLVEDLLAEAAPERAGKNATALELLVRASERIAERFAGRTSVAGAIHHTLGGAFAALGEFTEADAHIGQALALRRATLGLDAPDTLRSEIVAASLLTRRERNDEARRAFEHVLARARSVLGPDDRELYTALNDLGVALLGLGRFEEARAALGEALEGRRRLLGAHDPEVLTTLGNLAFVHEGQGEIEASLALQLETLALAESLVEPPPMTLLGFNNNIGATLQDLGRDAEAAPFLRRAAAIAAERLGPRHPDTLTIRNNLAALEAELGDPARAAAIHRELAEAYAETLGKESPMTLSARYGYLDALGRAQHAEEAAAGLEELLRDADQALGDGHWLVPQTAAALARALIACGRAEEAHPLALEAETRLRELLGPDHARTRSAGALRASLESAPASPRERP